MKNNISLDETMFIIGSGPCLNKIDIKLLKGLNTISLNRQYIAYDDWGFWPKYYVCIDWRLIGKIFLSDILPMMRSSECKIEKFFILANVLKENIVPSPSYIWAWNGDPVDDPKLIKIPVHSAATWSEETIQRYESCFVDPATAKERFSLSPAMQLDPLFPRDWSARWDAGKRGLNFYFRGSAGAFSTSLTHALGYKRAVLLGMDASYVERENSLKAGKDLNHFHPNYFDVDEYAYNEDYGPAQGYYEPWRIISGHAERDIQKDNASWNLHGNLCADKTFEVISCSPGSTINDLFEYVDLEELLKSYEVSNED